MFKKLNTKLFMSLILLVACSIFFYACEQKEQLQPTDEKTESVSLFKQHLADQTQRITAQDQGNGTYNVTGRQGTQVKIKDALINSAGERVRGTVEIELIEIYTVADMILSRKQTMADYDGQLGILESGGEVYVQVYQNGEQLSVDGQGNMHLLLPTENTGEARNDMELFYGEEIGDQVIWNPTGQPVRVVNSERRNGTDYLVMVQNILGWINVDVLYSLTGEGIDCIELIINCDETCAAVEDDNTVVALHVMDVNSAFELVSAGNNTFKLCSIEGEGTLPLGGIDATFIVIIDCGEGLVQAAIITTTLTPGHHRQVVDCEQLRYLEEQELQQLLLELAG